MLMRSVWAHVHVCVEAQGWQQVSSPSSLFADTGPLPKHEAHLFG